MKSDIKVKDPAKRSIVPKVTSNSSSSYLQFKFPSRFSRKKRFEGSTVSEYNNNFKKMPKDF